MQRCCIYKIKENKSLGTVCERFSPYVYVMDFAYNPLDDDKILCTYHHVNIKTMEEVSMIGGTYVLDCETFEKYFELYMEVGEINQVLRQLERERMGNEC